MGEQRILTSAVHPRLRPAPIPIRVCCDNRGQALVEFTLIFVLLVVVAWIPADFGLAFYTGQLAQNAAREGARIAAASNPVDVAEVITETCKRVSPALLKDPGGAGISCLPYSNARVTVILDPDTGTNCNRLVTVTFLGRYNYFFYQLLRLMKASTPPFSTISRSTSMRWEHQAGC
jgi:Flp pilus assembly protein TadG